MRSIVIGIAAMLLTSCATSQQDDPQQTAADDQPVDGIVLLDARDQLKRVSVDLRGVHPSEAEYQAIDANPELYEAFVDRYLQDPRFLDRMEELYNIKFLTRTGDVYFENAEDWERGLAPEVVASSVNDEPLQLMRKIIGEDLPYTTLVTAPYTMADPVTAWMWGISIPPDSHGWVEGHYTDGRPERGILTMTTMWGRYPSAGVNGNRHRANQLSRMLLCDDYLARPVSFSRTTIDALTSGDPEDVIRQTATCQSCHASLDPFAGNFFGFWYEVDGDFRAQTTYRPEDEELWRDHSGKPPGYFGHPTTGIEELSTQIAADDRFVQCGVRTVFEGLTQRGTNASDWKELDVHEAAFRDSGLTVRALVKSVVMSRSYRAGGTEHPDGVQVDDHMLGELVTVKQASPAQLASIIEEKTGYRWSFRDRDGMTSPESGLPVLGGGVDSRYVVTPSHDPSVGVVFIQDRLAQAAAHHVAVHDLDKNRTDDAILLKYVTVLDTPESNHDAFVTQLKSLYLDITGHAIADDDEVIENLITLWKQLYSVEASPTTAWAGVTSVVLRDPQVLFY